MPAIEELLAGVLGEDSSEEKTASTQETSSTEDGQLDVASFVEEMGKTASALEKAAESLPSTPGLVAEQLRMLDNPLGIKKDQVHDQHKGFVGQVLPSARGSLSVPKSLDAIQKSASTEEDAPAASFLRSWIGS